MIWTDALLDEWADVIVHQHHRTPQTAAAVTAAIREFFPEGKIEHADYRHLIAEMPGNDPDDHAHMAAAIVGGAPVLLTNNRRDFPSRALAARGLRVVDPDTYLCELVDSDPHEVTATIVRLAAEKQRPPKTPDDLLNDLARAGAKRFATATRKLLRPEQ
jgi:hypothetical protein